MIGLVLAAALLTGCADSCEVEGPLDYAAPASWLCRPDAPGACPDSLPVVEVAADGTTTSDAITRATDPDLACFAVYPTLDLRLHATLHHDVEDLGEPAAWAHSQAGPLAAACALWVPVYRQVTIGAYLGPTTPHKARCFDSAYADVLAAFEAFLAAEPDRGVVLFGHSQGGMHLSRLIRERIETDPALRARLVAAYPLGWALGTERGSRTGGSFDAVPVCETPDETGCVIGYRSYLFGEDPPTIGAFQEGPAAVCSHPGAPADPTTWSPLRALTASADHAIVRAPPQITDPDALVRWPDAMEARCVEHDGYAALQVRWVREGAPPFNPRGLALTGSNGTHVLDLNLGLADLVEDVIARGAAWSAARE